MTEQSAAIKAMQDCITDIRKCMLADELKLNDDKTELIIIGTRQQLAKVSIDSLLIRDEIIAPSSGVRAVASVNWGGGVYIHIFVFCPTNFF